MIKYLFALLLSISVQANDSIEFIGSGITWHVIDTGTSNRYSNQISRDGRLINTPQFGLRKIHVDKDFMYHSLTLFTAANSIGSPIYGGIGAIGAEFFGFFHAGLTIGGYVQNNNDFAAHGIVPFSLTPGTNAIVPILGVEMNVQVVFDEGIFVGLNNLITPIITNHCLSLGVKYD
jgi:hypothetical protein